MKHLGLFCPNAPGHLNPMVALADALRARGHQTTFFLLGRPPKSVLDAGLRVVPAGGSIFPPEDFQTELDRLGKLEGRAALLQTFAIAGRATSATLDVAPRLVKDAWIDALVVDQVSMAAGTVADQLGLPFVTVCNAMMLHSGPEVPPFFTSWRPSRSPLARLKNRLAWAGLDRLYAPALAPMHRRRRELGLSPARGASGTWSDRLQVSQQPEAFEFPRRRLPDSFRFVGPLRLPNGYPPVPFPWDRLDGRPLIYASLGTVQNKVAGAYRTIAEGCAGLDAQLVMSTGGGVPLESLEGLPGAPIVVSYAPQLDVLARADLVVTHAGLNTVLDALGLALPIVAIPIANEQPGIAARVEWTGAGVALPFKKATPDRLRALIQKVRNGPQYREAARRVQASIQKGGGAPRAAALVDEALGLGGGRFSRA